MHEEGEDGLLRLGILNRRSGWRDKRSDVVAQVCQLERISAETLNVNIINVNRIVILFEHFFFLSSSIYSEKNSKKQKKKEKKVKDN